MQNSLDISKQEYISIYMNRGKKVRSNISLDSPLKKVKYLTKQDLIHLATIRGLVFDESDLDNVIQALSKNLYDNKLNREIYREIEKRKYARYIIDKVKRTKRLKNTSLTKLENISEEDLLKLEKYGLLQKTLRKLVQLRGVETTGLLKTDLMYILMRTEKTHREDNYLQHLLTDPITQIKMLINAIKQNIIKLDRLFNKSEQNKIRNRLYETENLKPRKRQAKILIKGLTDINNNFAYKTEQLAFDRSGYYGIKDLEYLYDDLDNYYKPILVKERFEGNYQMYTIRGDKDSAISFYEYILHITPHLIDSIDKKKILNNNKIQLVIAINLIHLEKNDISTFYVQSKNVICISSDDTSIIVDEVLESLSKYYYEKLMIARTDSSYIFYSVNEVNIHFYTVDLKRTGTYIQSPKWLEDKNATVNPRNVNDNYCFAYAATIAIYHNEIGRNLHRISSKLIEYTDKLIFNGINFPC